MTPLPALSLPLLVPALTSWAAALVLVGCSAQVGAATAAIGAVGGLAVAAVPTGGLGGCRNAVLAALMCVAAVAGTVAFHVRATGTGPVAELAERGAVATVEVVLTDDPRRRPGHGGLRRRERFAVPARVEAVETAAGRVTSRAPVVLLASGEAWRSLLPSQRVAVRGRFGPADPGELLSAVVSVRTPPRVMGGPSWIQRVAGALRAGLREAAAVLPPAQRGLLPGLVVGDVSRMDEQVKADFKQAGLSHLTAVSGDSVP